MSRHAIFIAGVFIVLFIVFASLVCPLMPLYTDKTLRHEVRSQLEAITNQKGWLLSDITLKKVTKDSVRFTHQVHLRSSVPSKCYQLSLIDSVLTACDAL